MAVFDPKVFDRAVFDAPPVVQLPAAVRFVRSEVAVALSDEPQTRAVRSEVACTFTEASNG